MKSTNNALSVQGISIAVVQIGTGDYVSLTDMAKFQAGKEARQLVFNWMSTYYTLDFLATWEQVNNPNFKCLEFQTLRNKPGRLAMTPQRWQETTDGIGIFSKRGRHGGIFAHKDIAFEFGTWLSPIFKYYLIVEFQRMQEQENKRLSAEWNLQRTLAKINWIIRHYADTNSDIMRTAFPITSGH